MPAPSSNVEISFSVSFGPRASGRCVIVTRITTVDFLGTIAQHDFEDEDCNCELDVQLDYVRNGSELNIAEFGS